MQSDGDSDYLPPPKLQRRPRSKKVVDQRIERKIVRRKNPLQGLQEFVGPEGVILTLGDISEEQKQKGDENETQTTTRDLEHFGEFVEMSLYNNGVLGRGKGTVYPEFEMDSIYNYIVPEILKSTKKEDISWKHDPAISPEDIRPKIL